ncbi:MAG: NUDIX hydrolase, partial [Gammaproteobacteria bacterium]
MAERDDPKQRLAGWEVLSSDELYSHPYFRFRKDRCALPDERVMPAYYVMEFLDWVNVVALTD